LFYISASPFSNTIKAFKRLSSDLPLPTTNNPYSSEILNLPIAKQFSLFATVSVPKA
jgi:hypothetical protein